MMYHVIDKTVNEPVSEITGKRGGIHNSCTRILVKPTAMVGGYAHLAYGFNYYGPVGSQRDAAVVVRKLSRVEWKQPAPRSDQYIGEY